MTGNNAADQWKGPFLVFFSAGGGMAAGVSVATRHLRGSKCKVILVRTTTRRTHLIPKQKMKCFFLLLSGRAQGQGAWPLPQVQEEAVERPAKVCRHNRRGDQACHHLFFKKNSETNVFYFIKNKLFSECSSLASSPSPWCVNMQSKVWV